MEHAQTNQASRSHRIAYNASAHCMLPSIHARQQQAVQSRSRGQGRGRKHNVLSAVFSSVRSAVGSKSQPAELPAARETRNTRPGSRKRPGAGMQMMIWRGEKLGTLPSVAARRRWRRCTLRARHHSNDAARLLLLYGLMVTMMMAGAPRARAGPAFVAPWLPSSF
jgi:hypothetical protein